MAQVRALYEESAVPVREIARRAGVTERTLYKYACKGQGRPRYLWNDASACCWSVVGGLRTVLRRRKARAGLSSAAKMRASLLQTG